MSSFADVLKSGRPLVLDGGLATRLEARGHDIDTPLWSAALLTEQPRAIVDAHLDFLRAGARCITSASYQASRGGFMSLGFGAGEADALVARAVELALQAREEFMREQDRREPAPLVAASIGPWGATLHDGSEYSGRYDVDTARLHEFHAERLALLDTGDADLLACETIPNRAEAAVLAELLAGAGTPAWVSFACRDARSISDGTALRDIAALFADHPKVQALGVNCTPPGLITPLIGELRGAAPDVAVVVYPNSGEAWTPGGAGWHGRPAGMDFGACALEWYDAGARLIGGCCRVTPRDVARMARALEDRPTL